MKRSILLRVITLLFLINFSGSAFSQTQARKNVSFPDIAGYVTLKCDFHAHTIFSDGWVTPEYRVREAWVDGLDVLAITDHLGSSGRVKCTEQEKKEHYDQAYTIARELGLVLVPGTELTRRLPMGHYNLLFIREFGSIKEGPYLSVLKKARKQSAYIEWNHPGWTQPNLIPIWYKDQQKVYKKKLMDGLEIVNDHEYYPLAFTWAINKHLTIIGNSDIHDSTKNNFNPLQGKHRPMTLVIAKDKSLNSIKEAMLAGRTIVYYCDTLYGDTKFILPLFHASVDIPNKHLAIYRNDPNKENAAFSVKNNSSFSFILKLAEKVADIQLPEIIVIKGLEETMVNVFVNSDAAPGDRDYYCKYKVLNLHTGPGECPVIELPLHLGIF